MPSHSTRVLLAPDEPVARKDTPWVVGFATTLDDRRNKLKPGTCRNLSSRLLPGMVRSCSWSTTVMEAGLSLVSEPTTVTVVVRGFCATLPSGEGDACAFPLAASVPL